MRLRPLLTLSTAFILSLLAAVSAQSADENSQRAEALTLAKKHIPNFREVAPGIYRGGNPTTSKGGTQGLDALGNLGVATVINLQGGEIDGTFTGWVAGMLQHGDNPEFIEKERRYVTEKLKMNWEHRPLNSRRLVNQRAAEDIWVALQTMADPKKRPVFIHCQHGADRTGLVIALYRVLYQGWTREAALKEWRETGHGPMAEMITGALDVYFHRTTGNHPTADALEYLHTYAFIDGMLMYPAHLTTVYPAVVPRCTPVP